MVLARNGAVPPSLTGGRSQNTDASSWWTWWKEGGRKEGEGSLPSISSVKEESRSPGEHERWGDDTGRRKS